MNRTGVSILFLCFGLLGAVAVGGTVAVSQDTTVDSAQTVNGAVGTSTGSLSDPVAVETGSGQTSVSSGESNHERNNDSRNTSKIDQRPGSSSDGGMVRPGEETRPGIPYSVNRPVDSTPTFEQPNGVTFEAVFWSAGVTGGWRTADGYTVLSGEDGYWYYAIRSDGRLVPSDARVGIDEVPASIPTELAPSVPTGGTRPDTGATTNGTPIDGATVGVDTIPSMGNQSIPLVMINFSDTSTSYSRSEFQSLLFGDDPNIATGPGSVTDYYEEISSGQLTLTGNVSGWETADNSQSYYGSGGIGDGGSPTGAAELVKEAAQKADDQVDFARYDNDDDCVVDQFAVTHQGGGQETTGKTEDIWSHRWFLSAGTGSRYASADSSPGCPTIYVNGYTIQPETLNGQMATIGVYAHEFGHGLGLPDLYDTNGGSAGIGNWGLMGSGSYGAVIRSGDAPNHMTAWSKAYLDWLDPLEVTTGEARDEVTLKNVSKNNDYLKLLNEANNTNGEYFYVENRQEVGFDQGLPGKGLLVTHVNESRIADNCFFYNDCNADEDNKLVDVEAADGREDMDDNRNRGDAGDPWDESASPFDDTSNPSSKYDNGTSSNARVSGIQFSDGTTEGTATFDVSAGTPANFTVDIVETSTPVEGEELNVTASINNTGETQDTQTITLDVGALGSNTTSVMLTGGGSTNVTLSVPTSSGDAGKYTATVSSADDAASTIVAVLTPANFTVDIVDADTPIEGETLNVTASIDNTGDTQDTQAITLSLGALGTDSTSVTLAGGDSTNVTLGVRTSAGDAGNYTATVSSADDAASTDVTVLAPANFTVAIDSTTSPVTARQALVVNVTVENPDNSPRSRDVTLSVTGTERNTTQVSLAGGASTTIPLTWDPARVAPGSYTVAASSPGDRETTNVTIQQPIVSDYANQSGIVEIGGLLDAIDDWQDGIIDTVRLLDVIDAWRSAKPV